MAFTNQKGIRIVQKIIDKICANRDELSKLDAIVGDGDHGINMSKGLQLTRDALKEDMNMSEGFMTMSTVLVSQIGGSMGPLYGSFFRGFAIASREKSIIDQWVLLQMFQKGYQNIQKVTTAKVGDKTLIDVLDPAITAYKREVNRGQNLVDSFHQMMTAAKNGLESTKNMVAKVGRGSRLGERTIGHPDAGATSCFLILQSMADTSIELSQNQS